MRDDGKSSSVPVGAFQSPIPKASSIKAPWQYMCHNENYTNIMNYVIWISCIVIQWVSFVQWHPTMSLAPHCRCPNSYPILNKIMSAFKIIESPGAVALIIYTRPSQTCHSGMFWNFWAIPQEILMLEGTRLKKTEFNQHVKELSKELELYEHSAEAGHIHLHFGNSGPMNSCHCIYNFHGFHRQKPSNVETKYVHVFFYLI